MNETCNAQLDITDINVSSMMDANATCMTNNIGPQNQMDNYNLQPFKFKNINMEQNINVFQ